MEAVTEEAKSTQRTEFLNGKEAAMDAASKSEASSVPLPTTEVAVPQALLGIAVALAHRLTTEPFLSNLTSTNAVPTPKEGTMSNTNTSSEEASSVSPVTGEVAQPQVVSAVPKDPASRPTGVSNAVSTKAAATPKEGIMSNTDTSSKEAKLTSGIESTANEPTPVRTPLKGGTAARRRQSERNGSGPDNRRFLARTAEALEDVVGASANVRAFRTTVELAQAKLKDLEGIDAASSGERAAFETICVDLIAEVKRLKHLAAADGLRLGAQLTSLGGDLSSLRKGDNRQFVRSVLSWSVLVRDQAKAEFVISAATRVHRLARKAADLQVRVNAVVADMRNRRRELRMLWNTARRQLVVVRLEMALQPEFAQLSGELFGPGAASSSTPAAPDALKAGGTKT